VTDAEIRALFPGAAKVRYFNAASQGLMPTPVADAVRATLDRHVAVGIHAFPEDMERVEAARKGLARMIGAEPADVAFTLNTADAVARVADGLDWREGDEVVLCDLEFPANVYPWAAQGPRGVRLRMVPSERGRIEPSRLIDALGPRTRVLAVSMVQFTSGYRLDLAPLGAACRERGVLFFVDVIQGLGVYPVDVGSMGIGALAGEGRKWLLAPPGTGFLHVAPEWVERIRPRATGAMSVDPAMGMLGWVPRMGEGGDLDLDPVYRKGAGRYEAGYYNMAGLAGLAAALALFESMGADRVRRIVEDRVEGIVHGLRDRGFSVYGPTDPAERSGIVSFRVPGDPEACRKALGARSISVGVREGFVRAAPHVYNSEEDVERLLEAL
jgi:selenocysteine lyase/cysteine desulfurase